MGWKTSNSILLYVERSNNFQLKSIDQYAGRESEEEETDLGVSLPTDSRTPFLSGPVRNPIHNASMEIQDFSSPKKKTRSHKLTRILNFPSKEAPDQSWLCYDTPRGTSTSSRSNGSELWIRTNHGKSSICMLTTEHTPSAIAG